SGGGGKSGLERLARPAPRCFERMYGHHPRLQRDFLARPRTVVSTFAVHLERRIGRRRLLDLAREVLEDRHERGHWRAAVAGGDDPALHVERIGFAAELDGEGIGLA